MLLVLALVFGLFNIVLNSQHLLKLPPASQGGAPPVDQLKALALKLEKQDLSVQAAKAWTDYLDVADLQSGERAAVWYRIGKLYQEQGEEAEALACYYRSETESEGQEYSADLNMRVQECLERLGKFAALRYELAGRVSLRESDKTKGEEVLAEIGERQITEADLDSMVEREIDQQLSALAAFLPEDVRNERKEQLLKELTSPANRFSMLQQLVSEEMLYRKAREDDLVDESEVRAVLNAMERRYLAQHAMERWLGEQIRITSSDLRTYYEANKQNFVRPERVQIRHILFEDRELAAQCLSRTQNGEGLEDVVNGLVEEGALPAPTDPAEVWLQRGTPPPGFTIDQASVDKILTASEGEVIGSPVESGDGFHVVQVLKHETASQRPFEEVELEVYRSLRAQKEAEAREGLLADLQEKFDVVIHQSLLTDSSGGQNNEAN